VKELAQLMGGTVEMRCREPGTELLVRAPLFFTENKPEPIISVDDFFSDNMVQLELSSV
jgi:hypothetical protein